MALQNYTHAIKCYQEQLERAQDLQDSAIEAEAFGNLGIAKLNRYATIKFVQIFQNEIGYYLLVYVCIITLLRHDVLCKGIKMWFCWLKSFKLSDFHFMWDLSFQTVVSTKMQSVIWNNNWVH